MKPIVISLGGSIVVPDEIDVDFLKNFRQLILKIVKTRKVILIIGGGKTCRKYQKAASTVAKLKDEDIDWLGIHATRLNAQLLKIIFKDYCHKQVIHNPTEKIDFKEKILVASGWKPGHSTDYDAVLLAKNFGAGEVINITNIGYVYDRDPRIKGAKKLTKLTWKQMREIVGSKWTPGMNVPFDPIACIGAERMKLKVMIAGKDIKNLENIFSGKKFEGTIIY